MATKPKLPTEFTPPAEPIASGALPELSDDLETEREAPADGSEHVLVEGPALVVRALASFHDALTRRDYRAGDVVPWDLERAVHYAARGLVAVEDL